MQTTVEPTGQSARVMERNRAFLAGLPILALLALFLVIITRRAWIGDDAYITFRTVDNFIHGYSLTWNPGERVQAYTHPLWMFLLSAFYFVTHEIYFTSVFLSLGVSLVAAALYATRVARSQAGAALGILILTLSNAFVDYSTSGLENPLTHLLLAVFFVVYFSGTPSRRRLFWLSLVASLGAVNRMDTILLYIPALLWSWWELPARERGRAMLPALAGQTPFILWELFSIVYYGFPFPNTAYAKLNIGVPSGDLIVQGLSYYLNSIDHDPLTLPVIFGGLLLAFATRNRRGMALSLGMLLYLGYIIKIGGDFMGGRFFSAPLFCAVALIGLLDFRELRPAALGGVFAVVALLGVIAPLPSWRTDIPATYSLSDEKSINDERAWYFKDVNLLGRSRMHPYPTSRGREGGLAARATSQVDYTVIPVNNIGLYGYYAGPNVYIIDQYALADPLLARLPPIRSASIYIGHFHRIVPDGYIQTLYSGHNQLEDEDLARYYDQLRLIVRGSLFSPKRWAAIWKMNTGQLNSLIDSDRYRYPDMVKLNLKKDGGSPVNFGDSGVELDLSGLSKATKIQLELDSKADFSILYYHGKTQVAGEMLYGSYRDTPMTLWYVTVPAAALQSGYDHIRVFPLGGSEKGEYHLGKWEMGNE